VIRWDEAADHVAVATIDRPGRRNALDADLCEALREHLAARRELRAVVVTGAGRVFCAGADLARRAADTAEGPGDGELDHGGLRHGGADSFRPAFERLLEAVVEHPAPVLAAVDGPALGAGMQLAVACDLRVVGPEARFAIPAARLGVLLSPANVRRLALLVGHGAARDLLLTGRSVGREEAAGLGLVQRAADDAAAGALELAREIAGLAPLSVQGHKRALNLVLDGAALPDAAAAEIRALEARTFASDDLQEGLAAFADKRAPRFRGR
jgi:enoyl-CoA hydratase